ncbi:MAG: HAMP domain-containing protein, partial [Defluviitaleaceae bacterium]|nr:HAMP domain-containing protein [Defluviitaleaceae bacterium]
EARFTYVRAVDQIMNYANEIVWLEYRGTSSTGIQNRISSAYIAYNNALEAVNLDRYLVFNSGRLSNYEKEQRFFYIDRILEDLEIFYNELFLRIGEHVLSGDYSPAYDLLVELTAIYDYLYSSITSLMYISNEFHYEVQNQNSAHIRFVYMFVAVTTAAIVIFFIFIGSYLSFNIAKPISKISDIISSIAKGNLNVEIPEYRNDEIGTLIRAAEDLKEELGNLLENILSLREEVIIKGNVDYRIPEKYYSYAYHSVISTLNDYSESFSLDIMEILNFVTSIAEGDFNFRVEKMPGKKVVLTICLQSLLSNLKDLSKEIENLSKGVKSNIDLEMYSGEWKNIMANINELKKRV